MLGTLAHRHAADGVIKTRRRDGFAARSQNVPERIQSIAGRKACEVKADKNMPKISYYKFLYLLGTLHFRLLLAPAFHSIVSLRARSHQRRTGDRRRRLKRTDELTTGEREAGIVAYFVGIETIFILLFGSEKDTSGTRRAKY